MKKKFASAFLHPALSLLLSVSLMLTLGACGDLSGVSSFDATAFVKGYLSATYLGVYDGVYLDLTEQTEQAATAAYDKNLEREYSLRFTQRFGIDDKSLSKETRRELQQFLEDLYGKAQFQVAAATPLPEDEYAVKVTFTPVTLLQEFYTDDLPHMTELFEKKYEATTDEVLAAMTAPERTAFTEAMDEDWAVTLLTAMEGKLTSVGFGEPVVKLVRVYPDEKAKGYVISDSDYVMMDDLILAY